MAPYIHSISSLGTLAYLQLIALQRSLARPLVRQTPTKAAPYGLDATQRQYLREMPDHLLRDIGVCRSEIQ
jgi:uncharacterized protein YjiS (DUF1127 family)